MEKAWIVAVDMGYGHQRAAFALKGIAQGGEVISANNYLDIPDQDRSVWENTRDFYDFISRFKKVPILGKPIFGLMDKIQEIKPLYPKKRSLTPPTLQLKTIYRLMEKKDWGRHLIEKLNQNPIPLIATFSIPAFMAEHWKYKGPIYLLVTDSDIARTWVSSKPRETRIKYLVPSQIVAERLGQYGVPEKNIIYTGFPLPEELTNMDTVKKDLKKRLVRLDPKGEYVKKYTSLVKKYLGSLPSKVDGPPTITFAIGGAGAQQELGQQIIEALVQPLKEHKLKLIMAAGTHMDAVSRFSEVARKLDLSRKEVEIMACADKDGYFKEFADALHETDVLWTKPSEVSFYAALGIPLLLSPPIGSQEVRNSDWLLQVGSAVNQLNPKYAAEWIIDFIDKGLFAEAALQGFVEMERGGVANITKAVLRNRTS